MNESLSSAAETARAEAGGKNVLRIIDRAHGDLTVTWDPKDSASVTRARGEFQKATSRGMAGFVMDGGAKNRLTREFDPSAEVTVMAPALVGG